MGGTWSPSTCQLLQQPVCTQSGGNWLPRKRSSLEGGMDLLTVGLLQVRTPKPNTILSSLLSLLLSQTRATRNQVLARCAYSGNQLSPGLSVLGQPKICITYYNAQCMHCASLQTACCGLTHLASSLILTGKCLKLGGWTWLPPDVFGP